MSSESATASATPLLTNISSTATTNNNVTTTNNNATPSGRMRTNSVSNHHYAVHMSKADEIEVQVLDQNQTEQPEEVKVY